MRNPRLGGALIALGSLGLVAWLVTNLVAYQLPNELVVAEVASTAVYVLAGFACWRWMAGCRKAGIDSAIVRGPSRVMAVAAVVLAASFAANAYYRYQFHQSELHIEPFDPHYRLTMAGFAAMILGSLLAGVGFWIATAARPPVGSEVAEAPPSLTAQS
jgi:hypothetical protein